MAAITIPIPVLSAELVHALCDYNAACTELSEAADAYHGRVEECTTLQDTVQYRFLHAYQAQYDAYRALKAIANRQGIVVG